MRGSAAFTEKTSTDLRKIHQYYKACRWRAPPLEFFFFFCSPAMWQRPIKAAGIQTKTDTGDTFVTNTRPSTEIWQIALSSFSCKVPSEMTPECFFVQPQHDYLTLLHHGHRPLCLFFKSQLQAEEQGSWENPLFIPLSPSQVTPLSFPCPRFPLS